MTLCDLKWPIVQKKKYEFFKCKLNSTAFFTCMTFVSFVKDLNAASPKEKQEEFSNVGYFPFTHL